MDSPAAQRRTDTGHPRCAVTALFAAVPVIAVLVATTRGPGLSPDSVNYISTGLNLADGRGLISYTETTLTRFPPGLPFMVALGDAIGLGPDWTFRLLNASAAGATVALAAFLLARHVSNHKLAIGATAFVAVSVALLEVASMAWSEPLFIVATLGFIIVMERALAEPHRWRWLAAGAVIVWGAFFVRYAAVPLVLVGGTSVLLGLWRQGRVIALRNAVAFGALASLGPGLWMLRNRSVDGNLTGFRYPSRDSPAEVGYRIVRTIESWFMPAELPAPLLWGIGAAALGAAILTLFMAWRTNSDDGQLADSGSLLPLLVFTGGYTAFLVASQLTTAFDQLNTRLLSPLLVPLVVIAAVVVDRLTAHLPIQLRRVGGVILVAIIAVQGVQFVSASITWGRNGQGFASAAWQDSNLAAASNSLSPTATVYSNQPAGLWAVTRRQPILGPPQKRVRRSKVAVPIPESFLVGVACSESYLVWFTNAVPGNLRTPQELSAVVTVDVMGEFDDGTLYRLGPLQNMDCDVGP